jgi:hypothetical protein
LVDIFNALRQMYGNRSNRRMRHSRVRPVRSKGKETARYFVGPRAAEGWQLPDHATQVGGENIIF